MVGLFLKGLFGQNAQKSLDLERDPLPEGFVEKFKAFAAILKAVGADMPDRFNSDSPYICAFDKGHRSETKKWVVIKGTSLHLRYYDRNLCRNSGLAVLDMDKDNHCYRIQKLQEFKAPEEAIVVFVNIIDGYADRCFMDSLKEKLAASDVLDFSVLDDQNEQVLDKSIDADGALIVEDNNAAAPSVKSGPKLIV
jgi:hypothetical protein